MARKASLGLFSSTLIGRNSGLSGTKVERVRPYFQVTQANDIQQHLLIFLPGNAFVVIETVRWDGFGAHRSAGLKAQDTETCTEKAKLQEAERKRFTDRWDGEHRRSVVEWISLPGKRNLCTVSAFLLLFSYSPQPIGDPGGRERTVGNLKSFGSSINCCIFFCR